MACRAHLGEVEKHSSAIQAAGAAVLVISPSKPEQAAAYLDRHPLPFTTLLDPSGAAYRAFGLGRTGWWQLLRPTTLARYLLLLFRGWLPRKPVAEDDVLQLGGDFVIDARGRLQYAYRSRTATDRPPARELVEQLRRLQT